LSIPLTIQNVTFDYPVEGSDPQWGSEAAGWAQAVTNALNTLLAPGDILQTLFNIPDNSSTPSNINGLAFDPSIVRAASIFYSVYRTSIDTPSGNAESGFMNIIYDNNAASGQKWKIMQYPNGSSGTVFSILDTGQFQFISSQIDMGGGGYSGIMKFSAKTTGI
jgi:hypothetical protein